MERLSGKEEAAAAAAEKPGNTDEASGGVAEATVAVDVNIGTVGVRAGLPANGEPLDNEVKGGNTGGIPGEEHNPIEDRVGLPILPLREESPDNVGFIELARFPGPGGNT